LINIPSPLIVVAVLSSRLIPTLLSVMTYFTTGPNLLRSVDTVPVLGSTRLHWWDHYGFCFYRG